MLVGLSAIRILTRIEADPNNSETGRQGVRPFTLGFSLFVKIRSWRIVVRIGKFCGGLSRRAPIED